MISLKSLLEGESNTDKFTYKQRDAGGVFQPYQSIKLIKMGEAKGYTKYNVILSGKFSGVIFASKDKYIGYGGDSNTTFPSKSFKSLDDAIHYVCSNSNPNYNSNIPLSGMMASFT